MASSSSARICCSSGRSGGAIRCGRRLVKARSSCVVLPTKERCEVSMTMKDYAPIREVKLEKNKKMIGGGGGGGGGGSVVSREKLDEWLRDSVVEIVKNLRQSPLLVHLYEEANGGLSTTAKTSPEVEDWEAMEEKWGRGEERTPEGVIFVEKLADEEGDEECDSDGGGACSGGEGTSAWGIVAQGRGTESGPVCYLLKTTRVGSGVGTVCTHFCLTKVKSFRETAVSQLSNSWLVQTGQ